MVNELGVRKEDQDWQIIFMLGVGGKCKNKTMINLLIFGEKRYMEKKYS